MALETAGEHLNFHPHLHSILTDGIINDTGEFTPLGFLDSDALRKLFEHKLMHALKHKSLITDTIIAQIRSWNTSGFSTWAGDIIKPSDQSARLFISQYLTKCPGFAH